jgi:hypothetical protein
MNAQLNIIAERRAILDQAKGQFFSVAFLKKDGTARSMTCKKWVEEAFTYGSEKARPNPAAHKLEYYNACEIGNETCFKNINLLTLTEAKVAGKVYKF